MVLKMVIDMLLNGCKGIAANVQPAWRRRGINVRQLIYLLQLNNDTNSQK